jgi:hypothetical protein
MRRIVLAAARRSHIRGRFARRVGAHLEQMFG